MDGLQVNATPNTVAIANSPTSSKRNPRSGSNAKRSSNPVVRIKTEHQDSPIASAPRDDSDSGSDYAESPAKTKKKRVRGNRKATANVRYKEPTPEPEEAEALNVQEAETFHAEEEYVGEAGGTNVVMKKAASGEASSAEPSPTESTFPDAHKYSTAGDKTSPFAGKFPSMGGKRLFPMTPEDSGALDATAGANRMEDVFVSPTGGQHVKPGPLLPSHPSFNRGGQSFGNGGMNGAFNNGIHGHLLNYGGLNGLEHYQMTDPHSMSGFQ